MTKAQILASEKIILENSYKVDYETVAERILQESVKYEQAIEALKSILDGGMF